MEPLLPIAALVAVAAITPGPNNLIVMRAAATSGFHSAFRTIAGVVLGSLGLLGLVAAGGGALFSFWPPARPLLTVAGCAYLGWMGLALMRSRPQRQGVVGPGPRLGSVAWFQLANPKGWVMVATAVAALPSVTAAERFLLLAPLFVGITGVCLLLWTWLGVSLREAVHRHAWVDRVLGAVLIGSTALLLPEAFS